MHSSATENCLSRTTKDMSKRQLFISSVIYQIWGQQHDEAGSHLQLIEPLPDNKLINSFTGLPS